MNFNIPDKIIICGIVYDVRLIECDEPIDGLTKKEFIGKINHESCIIFIDKNLNKQAMFQTFLHEISHGIEYRYCMKTEEDDIDRFAHGMYEIIKDNPNLFKEIGGLYNNSEMIKGEM